MMHILTIAGLVLGGAFIYTMVAVAVHAVCTYFEWFNDDDDAPDRILYAGGWAATLPLTIVIAVVVGIVWCFHIPLSRMHSGMLHLMKRESKVEIPRAVARDKSS